MSFKNNAQTCSSSNRHRLYSLIILREQERRICEGSYFHFLCRAWKEVEPETPLILNWHIKYLCDIFQEEIERIVSRKTKKHDLIINISPRSLKSKIASIFLAPWAWTRFPHLKFINSSHSMNLSTDHCVESRRIIDCGWYQSHWASVFKMTSDQNAKTFFKNSKNGYRMATSVSSRISGHGADIITADDLIDPAEARLGSARRDAVAHWEKSLFNRLNEPGIGLRAIIEQRTHVEDLTGVALQNFKSNFHQISIPAQIDKSNRPKPEALSEFYTGGLFFPDRFSESVLESYRKRPRDYATLYLQSPTNDVGALVKRDWWRFYNTRPERFDDAIASWDLAVKDKDHNDWSVGGVWGRKGPDYYLVALTRFKGTFEEQIRSILKMAEDYPFVSKTVIEDKANGSPILQTLSKRAGRVKGYDPKGLSKSDRLALVSPLIECGNVYLPDMSIASWVQDFLEEFSAFTGSSDDTDDQVDMTTQALIELDNGKVNTDWINFLTGK